MKSGKQKEQEANKVNRINRVKALKGNLSASFQENKALKIGKTTLQKSKTVLNLKRDILNRVNSHVSM